MARIDKRVARATVDVTRDGPDGTTVGISGELDLASVPGVEAQIEPVVAANPDRLVFDLSQVTFMDSSGIAMLLRAAGRVARVEVRQPSPAVQLIVQATGLTDVLHMDP